MQEVLVVGAGSRLGLDVAARLARGGLTVTATFRTPGPGVRERIAATGAMTEQLDLEDTARLRGAIGRTEAVVVLPILTASVSAARHLRQSQRAVFISSNNVAVVPDAPIYQGLSRAEATVRRAVPQAAILRPTMIYGHPEDGNLSRLAGAMQRWPVMPRPATPALQQPVFWRDVGAAVAGALLDNRWAGQTVALAGPDEVTFAQLYDAVRRAARLRRLVVPVSPALALRALRLLDRIGLNAPVGGAQLLRAGLDKRARGETVYLGRTSLDAGLRHMMHEIRYESV